MKKVLSILAFVLFFIGASVKSDAQCSGNDVAIVNVSIVPTATLTYKIVYYFIYNLGNASILPYLYCGGTGVTPGTCLIDSRSEWINNGSPAGPMGPYESTIVVPPSCTGLLKEIVFRIYASPSCGGTFCTFTPAQIPLPVSFKSFDALRSSSSVKLNWSTASENNNNGFAVERNSNGTWQQVGWVPTQAAAGNSDALLNYSFIDANNAKGVSQYRIRQVDLDGKTSYSVIRSVRGEFQPGKTLVYPNPTTNGKVNVLFEDGAVTRNVTVTDMSGRIVRQLRSVTTNNVTIEGLQPGMYVARIVASETGEQTIEKFVVNKQ